VAAACASFACLASQEVVIEASRGDPEQVRRRLAVLATLPRAAVSADAQELARLFLATGCLPLKAARDAVHLAVATAIAADYLLTWNCRHLANAQILRRLEREARRAGRPRPHVCTPLELMEDSTTTELRNGSLNSTIRPPLGPAIPGGGKVFDANHVQGIQVDCVASLVGHHNGALR
jgi:hypothetical protein